jgi:hypothetical protein
MDIYDPCLKTQLHTRDLHACMLVSKSWLDIALPHLWNYHARLRHLVALMYDGDQNSVCVAIKMKTIISDFIAET